MDRKRVLKNATRPNQRWGRTETVPLCTNAHQRRQQTLPPHLITHKPQSQSSTDQCITRLMTKRYDLLSRECPVMFLCCRSRLLIVYEPNWLTTILFCFVVAAATAVLWVSLTVLWCIGISTSWQCNLVYKFCVTVEHLSICIYSF